MSTCYIDNKYILPNVAAVLLCVQYSARTLYSTDGLRSARRAHKICCFEKATTLREIRDNYIYSYMIKVLASKDKRIIHFTEVAVKHISKGGPLASTHCRGPFTMKLSSVLEVVVLAS